MNQQLLRAIIKQTLLTEAPIDVWKAKNKSLPSEQKSQAEKYFVDLTGKYNASLHPIAKDLTSLSFEQLETLYKTFEMAKSKNLKAPFVKWLTKQLKQLPSLSLQQVIEDYIPPLLSLQKNKEKFDPNFLENLQRKMVGYCICHTPQKQAVKLVKPEADEIQIGVQLGLIQATCFSNTVPVTIETLYYFMLLRKESTQKQIHMQK